MRMKSVEGEGEAHVVDNILESLTRVALNNDIPDILPLINVRGVERGALTRLPGDDEIAGLDPAALFQHI
jgi:hypothetical protein